MARGWYERGIVESVQGYLGSYRKLDVVPPVLCFVSLRGIKGAEWIVGLHFDDDDVYQFDRAPFVLPDVVIDGLSFDVPAQLFPIFDMTWIACGLLRSFNYDEAGNWSVR